MQTEPTEASQKTSLDSAQDTQHTSQHGFHDPHNGADPLLCYEERAAESQPRPGDADATENAPSEAVERGFHKPERRLSSTSSRSSKRTGSPVDRIIEHEQALLTPPKGKNEGPAFSVIRRKTSGNERVTLTDFPNGDISDTESMLTIG